MLYAFVTKEHILWEMQQFLSNSCNGQSRQCTDLELKRKKKKTPKQQITNNRGKDPFPKCKKPLNLMFLFHLILGLVVTFCGPVCLLLGDKESKLCPWLLSLKLYLIEGFFVCQLPLQCAWERHCQKESVTVYRLRQHWKLSSHPAEHAQKRCIKQGLILKGNP